MKTFKSYLREAQAEFNTKDMIFTGADTPALILSTTALERVFGKLERIKAWHVTDLDGVKGLIKIQGKKSSISVMTEIEKSDSKPFKGIETTGGIVVELEGTELMSSDQDAWSERLEGGRRAINITKEGFPSMFRHMELMVKKMYEKYSKKPYPKDSRKAAMDFNQLGQTLSQKEKGQFIKEYIDNCEEILKKNKMGQKELRKYGRARITVLKKVTKIKHYYNESVVNQISIKKVYLVEEMIHLLTTDELEDALEDVKNVWKDVQIKSQKELISLINK